MTNHNTPMPSDHICIIGAGPAGLSAAMHLAERGYRHITILEKEDRVGGKCKNFAFQGVDYDMGANLTTPRYTQIRALAARLGVDLRDMAERRVVSLAEDEIQSLADANLLETLLLRAASAFYLAMRKSTGIDQNGYAGLPDGVKQSFGDWLDEHGLSRFREVFAVLFVAYGYGVMDDLPAAYALKFFDRIHWTTAVDTILGKDVETTKVFEGGFQRLWERVVEHWQLDVRLEADVLRVRRSPSGVDVEWAEETSRRTVHFDHLIVACPLDAALGFLDATDEEQRLFAQIEYYDYWVTATVVKNVPDISTFVFPYARQLTPGWPTVFYPPVPGDPNDVFVFYSYGGPGITCDDVHANLAETLANPAFDGELESILTTQRWRYFPHVSVEAAQNGFYEDLESLQGSWNTFYVGEVLSFTLVELVHEYSRQLVDSWFPERTQVQRPSRDSHAGLGA